MNGRLQATPGYSTEAVIDISTACSKTERTYYVWKWHGLFFWSDDCTLYQELVLALGIDREVLLHGLEHDWTAGCFMRSHGSRIGMDATYLQPRQSRRAPPCQSWALHSKAVEGGEVSPLSVADKAGEIERADLGGGRLDLEGDRLFIVVCNSESTFYDLC